MNHKPPLIAPAQNPGTESVAGVAAERKLWFPWLTIAICAVLMALYTGSPLDLIPDLVPIAGQLDDLLVDAGLMGIIVRALFRYYVQRPRSL